MSKSHAEHRAHASASSPENNQPSFSANIASAVTSHLPGTMNDAALVRAVVTESMRKSQLSRAEIAERMSYLTGTSVTERSLNNFSAESREDYRFPAELDRAFCAAVGDNRLLVCRAELAGLAVLDDTAVALMELGREFLQQKRSAAKIASLESRLAEVAL